MKTLSTEDRLEIIEVRLDTQERYIAKLNEAVKIATNVLVDVRKQNVRHHSSMDRATKMLTQIRLKQIMGEEK